MTIPPAGGGRHSQRSRPRGMPAANPALYLSQLLSMVSLHGRKLQESILAELNTKEKS